MKPTAINSNNQEKIANSHRRIALVAELHPAYYVKGGTANLIKTFCFYPFHPFCSIVAADHAGPNPVPGPWDSIPTLSLFRPRSLRAAADT